MNLSNSLLVFEKDWREVRRNWEVILPITIVPLLFSVVFPSLFFFLPASSVDNDFLPLIANLPEAVRVELVGMTANQIMVYVLVLYFFAPFFLIIPIMASSVIASDSFAGEKERKTIEGLLATPLSDGELMLGKILVSFIPSMAVTLLAFIGYCISVDVMSLRIFEGMLLLPNMNWILLIFFLSPAVALTAIGLTVTVSSRVGGFREAQQISILLILPVLGLLFGQASGAIIIGPTMILTLTVILLFLNIIIFKIGLKLFQREEILAKIR